MNWFERLTGFRETAYDETRSKLAVEGTRLRSLVNGQSYGFGEWEFVSLRMLREQARRESVSRGRLHVEVIRGDVRELHRVPVYSRALFQVASQFNMLEMMGPQVTPEDGVTGYQFDHTQGPACAIAAGAATVYRNYFVPVGDQLGQTASRQLDGLAGVGERLALATGRPLESLWEMRNGYALCSQSGLQAISDYLETLTGSERDALSGELRFGLHRDTEVTDTDMPVRPVVSQIFCSALPVAYSRVPGVHWKSFASLVLDAAYEATLWAGVLNAQRNASNVVLLTQLGGGAFGNEEAWIDAAMRSALQLFSGFDLRVKIVSHAEPSAAMLRLAEGAGRE